MFWGENFSFTTLQKQTCQFTCTLKEKNTRNVGSARRKNSSFRVLITEDHPNETLKKGNGIIVLFNHTFHTQNQVCINITICLNGGVAIMFLR
mmetsp:Transcript_4088/g.6027  ORF Transcript_4088/g.6027 Transcript_4088/m.6027 type:complete len:93 (+) Transcript_4088:1501-1779(+)